MVKRQNTASNHIILESILKHINRQKPNQNAWRSQHIQIIISELLLKMQSFGKVFGGSRLPGSFLFVECLSGFFTIKKTTFLPDRAVAGHMQCKNLLNFSQACYLAPQLSSCRIIIIIIIIINKILYLSHWVNGQE